MPYWPSVLLRKVPEPIGDRFSSVSRPMMVARGRTRSTKIRGASSGFNWSSRKRPVLARHSKSSGQLSVVNGGFLAIVGLVALGYGRVFGKSIVPALGRGKALDVRGRDRCELAGAVWPASGLTRVLARAGGSRGRARWGQVKDPIPERMAV